MPEISNSSSLLQIGRRPASVQGATLRSLLKFQTDSSFTRFYLGPCAVSLGAWALGNVWSIFALWGRGFLLITLTALLLMVFWSSLKLFQFFRPPRPPAKARHQWGRLGILTLALSLSLSACSHVALAARPFQAVPAVTISVRNYSKQALPEFELRIHRSKLKLPVLQAQGQLHIEQPVYVSAPLRAQVTAQGTWGEVLLAPESRRLIVSVDPDLQLRMAVD